MRLISLLFFFISVNASGQQTIGEAINKYNSHSVTYISVEELQQKLTEQQNIYLLDTREKKEFEVSHLKNAIWIGYESLNLENLKPIDKTATIVVYCSIGVRSEQIGEKLIDMGYQNVFNLYGGIFDWVNSSYSVFNSNGDPTRKVHAYDSFWGKFLNDAEKVY